MKTYTVRYVEGGEEKKFETDDRDEAFGFQTGLLARRKANADGTWDVDPLGVYTRPPLGREAKKAPAKDTIET